MKQEHLALISDTIRNVVGNCGEDVRLHLSYSGRGMFGRKCVGIAGSTSATQALLAEVISDLYDHSDSDEEFDFREAVRQLMMFSTDSMGYSIIMYWEQLPAVEELDEEDEDLSDVPLDDRGFGPL